MNKTEKYRNNIKKRERLVQYIKVEGKEQKNPIYINAVYDFCMTTRSSGSYLPIVSIEDLKVISGYSCNLTENSLETQIKPIPTVPNFDQFYV
jgi:hypothetical protein